MSLAKFIATHAKGKGAKIGAEIGDSLAKGKAAAGLAGDIAKEYPKGVAALVGGTLAGGVGLSEILGDDDEEEGSQPHRRSSGRQCKVCGK